MILENFGYHFNDFNDFIPVIRLLHVKSFADYTLHEAKLHIEAFNLIYSVYTQKYC